MVKLHLNTANFLDMLDILISRLYLNIKMKHADVLFVPLEKCDSQIIKFPNDTNESTFFV